MIKNKNRFNFQVFYKHYNAQQCYAASGGHAKIKTVQRNSRSKKISPQQSICTNTLTWLIGFAEGDGSFIVRSNKQLVFKIVQHSDDMAILHYIKDILGFGQVKLNTATTHCYIVGHTQELYLLILLFNDNIVVPKLHFINVSANLCRFIISEYIIH